MAMTLLLLHLTEDDRGNECYYPEGEYATMKEAKDALNELENAYEDYKYVIVQMRAEFKIETYKATKAIQQ